MSGSLTSRAPKVEAHILDAVGGVRSQRGRAADRQKTGAFVELASRRIAGSDAKYESADSGSIGPSNKIFEKEGAETKSSESRFDPHLIDVSEARGAWADFAHGESGRLEVDLCYQQANELVLDGLCESDFPVVSRGLTAQEGGWGYSTAGLAA